MSTITHIIKVDGTDLYTTDRHTVAEGVAAQLREMGHKTLIRTRLHYKDIDMDRQEYYIKNVKGWDVLFSPDHQEVSFSKNSNMLKRLRDSYNSELKEITRAKELHR